MASHANGHSSARLGDGSLMAEDFEEGLGHTMPVSTLAYVLASLMVLTVITVAVSRVDFGSWNVVIAMLIASIKAGIVGSFFMHLKFEGKVILMYVIYPLLVLFIFIGGSLLDVVDRETTLPLAIKPKITEPKIIGDAHHGETHGEAAAESSGAH